ncbi:DUF2007 domain-containing protein [Odoribacter sp. OttesenSCG-928-G04]|nr:DUF2007 domain-containing protein [Odoribacter sp. OttesenSCG-928-G04]
MDNNWTAVFSTDKLYQAELVKENLEENGIEAVILNQKDSAFLEGSIDVMVDNKHYEKAKEITKNIHLE